MKSCSAGKWQVASGKIYACVSKMKVKLELEENYSERQWDKWTDPMARGLMGLLLAWGLMTHES